MYREDILCVCVRYQIFRSTECTGKTSSVCVCVCVCVCKRYRICRSTNLQGKHPVCVCVCVCVCIKDTGSAGVLTYREDILCVCVKYQIFRSTECTGKTSSVCV